MDPNKTVQFNTTSELLNNPSLQFKISKSIEIEKAISFYQDKSRVNNTEKATKNWLEHFEKFRKSMIKVYPHNENYKTELKSISELLILDNQREVIGDAAQKVPILANSPNSRGSYYDYHLYFEKRPLDANQEFYLQTNPK
ncbi:14504_t:CDS:2, partial [Racocetra persica]